MQLDEKLSRIINDGQQHLLTNGKIGLEKESLRVDASGKISQKPHPVELGSALTNPYITTDYSEALLELITPPKQSVQAALEFLNKTHQFIYSKLENELLWNSSMPCVVSGEKSIPIAQYGTSNLGMMKTVYRRGLGHRYGKMMQVIAGVHFNYSLQESFWLYYQDLLAEKNLSIQDFISEQYFGLIRNLQRYGWLVYYLFGCSPAICKSFLEGQSTKLEMFDEYTYYLPYATSLRMGDIGYTNKKENEVGVKACYDSINSYISCLTKAIETPYPEYERIGVKVDGEYRQLNANILQIENEYYSTTRPKQPLVNNEKPTHALKQRGVQYVELRSLDLNLYEPLGVSAAQLYFLESFMIYCLLEESPLIDKTEQKAIDSNENMTAHQGRDPALVLNCNNNKTSIQQWGGQIAEKMQVICETLDKQTGCSNYTDALQQQKEKISDPDRTPSARMLIEMNENKDVFFELSNHYSKIHQQQFINSRLNQQDINFFTDSVQSSIEKQKDIESSDEISFDTFLQNYLKQTKA